MMRDGVHAAFPRDDGKMKVMARPQSMAWYVPPLILAIIACILDPVKYMRTGDPWFELLNKATGWCFLAAFAYLPFFLAVRFLIWVIRSCIRMLGNPNKSDD
jgi:hypothetical protein